MRAWLIPAALAIGTAGCDVTIHADAPCTVESTLVLIGDDPATPVRTDAPQAPGLGAGTRQPAPQAP